MFFNAMFDEASEGTPMEGLVTTPVDLPAPVQPSGHPTLPVTSTGAASFVYMQMDGCTVNGKQPTASWYGQLAGAAQSTLSGALATPHVAPTASIPITPQ
jgi:hypothetical protein